MRLEDLIPFEQILEEELRDPEFRAAWERLAPARAVANRLILYRAEHGLTQTALARLLGMLQHCLRCSSCRMYSVSKFWSPCCPAATTETAIFQNSVMRE